MPYFLLLPSPELSLHHWKALLQSLPASSSIQFDLPKLFLRTQVVYSLISTPKPIWALLPLVFLWIPQSFFQTLGTLERTSWPVWVPSASKTSGFQATEGREVYSFSRCQQRATQTSPGKRVWRLRGLGWGENLVRGGTEEALGKGSGLGAELVKNSRTSKWGGNL